MDRFFGRRFKKKAQNIKKLMLSILTTIASVYAGPKTTCWTSTSVAAAGLGTGCALATVGMGTLACALGSAAFEGVGFAACSERLGRRNVVIEQPQNVTVQKYAFCADFGPDHGFECIKPRHVKKLGDFMIAHPCDKPENDNVQKCLGSKFYATCDGGKWKPSMCTSGLECEQNGKKVLCVGI
jgi:hypothetical protein